MNLTVVIANAIHWTVVAPCRKVAREGGSNILGFGSNGRVLYSSVVLRKVS